MTVFKLMRIVALLTVLFVIVVGTWMTERRMANWERPTIVTIYPIAADDGDDTHRYLDALELSDFEPVNDFMEREIRPYGFSVTPAFHFQLAEKSSDLPPQIPDQFSPASIAWWSLKMRAWSWAKRFNDGLLTPDIQMFVIYYGVRRQSEIEISVGMRKGRYGVLNVAADREMQSRNLVVFTHELLHVFGASDKYTLSTGEPHYPFGYADPNQEPLFPQTRAEIMGGRIPLSANDSVMPATLEQCKIGNRTAEEIGFMGKLMNYD